MPLFTIDIADTTVTSLRHAMLMPIAAMMFSLAALPRLDADDFR